MLFLEQELTVQVAHVNGVQINNCYVFKSWQMKTLMILNLILALSYLRGQGS